MNFSQLASTNKLRFAYGVLAFFVMWFIAHAVAYLPCIRELGNGCLLQIFSMLRQFFLWQVAAFIVVILLTTFLRSAALSVICLAFFITSSAILLIMSHDAIFIANICVFFFWFLCATNTSRMAILRLAGPHFATWGLSMAFIFVVLVPVGFFLGLSGAIAPLPIAILAILTAMPGLFCGVRHFTTRSQKFVQCLNKLDFFDWFLLEITWLILAITFIGASGVETCSDAARVHLPYVHQVIMDQGISHQYACLHRLQPMAAQTCYAIFAAVGSDIAAKWFLWISLGTLVILIAEETYYRSKSLHTALFAGTLSLSCPILNFFATTLYIDLFITLLCTAGFIALFRALRPLCLKGILFSAVIMSSAVQTKYTGLIFVVIWGLILFFSLLAQCPWRKTLRWSLGAGLLLLLASSPWYIYVYHGTGNPFYPYLNDWFPTTYWVKGLTFQQMFEGFFKRPHGIIGAASFPWTATYKTSRFAEGWNGYIGFAIVALMPCWFLSRFRRSFLYWDMAIVGVAMVAGVVIYTPYIRYWLPAYPLLAASCALAFCTSFPVLERLWKGMLSKLGICITSAALTLVPAVFYCNQLPWDEYVRAISKDTMLANRFSGYKAIQQINSVISPNDGVLCIGFEGIYLFGGRPYDYNFFWNNIHHIDSLETFAKFCQRYRIRYWAVSNVSIPYTNDNLISRIVSHYWTNERLVAAAEGTAIYDVTDSPVSSPQQICRVLPAVLDTSQNQWTPQTSSECWMVQYADPNIRSDTDTIRIDGPGRLLHRLEPSANKGICKVECNLKSENSCDPILRCIWFDKSGKPLTNTTVSKTAQSDFSLWLYVPPAPTGAEACWLYLWKWRGMSLQLKNTTITWITLPSTTNVAKRNISENH